MIDGTRRATGDRLLVGMALENADHHIEVSVDVEKGELKPLRGTTPEGITGWTCRCERDDAGRLTCVLVAPVGTLGADRLGQGRHMLLSVHYENHGDADQPVRVHRWGGGLDGSCSSAEFRWIELVRRR